LQRRMLTIHDRVEIGAGLQTGLSIRYIAARIDRSPSVLAREIERNQTKTRGYRIVTAYCNAERRRSRPQPRKVATDAVLVPVSWLILAGLALPGRSRAGCS
jgi:IS30 family transposase